jgi:N-acetylmuramoyl-L-alanine amidase
MPVPGEFERNRQIHMGATKKQDARPAQKTRRIWAGRLLGLIVLVALLTVAAIVGRYGYNLRPFSTASAASGGEALDPAEFATGSCVAYPPTAGDRGETVFLDAGHGGIDPGGVGITQSGKTIY